MLYAHHLSPFRALLIVFHPAAILASTLLCSCSKLESCTLALLQTSAVPTPHYNVWLRTTQLQVKSARSYLHSSGTTRLVTCAPASHKYLKDRSLIRRRRAYNTVTKTRRTTLLLKSSPERELRLRPTACNVSRAHY
ncbi:hypothetical protein OH76DRAFT_1562404 [Lentinus brumalis]|uniref:Secreted protein n=1 Tax=Lentinus brumalis TaxID=2498619 RepID=A0A371CGN9_9APHY|nr:hypothetical protein OH76DRAFT_1562404 [Polyporus brumalis]